jgi:Helix-turn-helix domain
MKYDLAIKVLTNLGMTDVLPDYFKLIDDYTIYPVSEMAEIINMHPESVRRWCRNGQIKAEGVSHYKIQGIEMKRFLYQKINKRFPSSVKSVLENK